jgi:hypothetical protein
MREYRQGRLHNMSQDDFNKRIEGKIKEVKKNTYLGPDSYKLRNIIAEGGFEITPDELHDALAEARVRIGYGTCKFCRSKNKELRYGMCFKCLMASE